MKKIIEKIESRKIFGRVMRIIPLSGGIVNQTFEVVATRGHIVLQKVKTGLGGISIADYIRLQEHLEKHGYKIPRLIDHWEDADGSWKVTSYMDSSRSPSIMCGRYGKAAAGYLSGIHEALASFDCELESSIPGFHDSVAIFEKLRNLMENGSLDEVFETAASVFEAQSGLSMPYWPKQFIHGDPKFGNFLFSDSRYDCDVLDDEDDDDLVVSLIDWDTLMKGNIMIDIGDMARSFCRKGNGDFDQERLKEMSSRYFANTGEVFTEISVLEATKLVTLELAARFLIDWFEDSYFGWDAAKFGSRKESNLASAQKYLAYFKTMPESMLDGW